MTIPQCRTTCSWATKGGHPRHSNYADRSITPAAEGLYPPRKGIRRPVYVTAEPWPGIPISKGNKKIRAADLAEATWPDLTGKLHPHDYADTCLMPMSVRSACSAVVSGLKMSA